MINTIQMQTINSTWAFYGLTAALIMFWGIYFIATKAKSHTKSLIATFIISYAGIMELMKNYIRGGTWTTGSTLNLTTALFAAGSVIMIIKNNNMSRLLKLALIMTVIIVAAMVSVYIVSLYPDSHWVMNH